MIKYLTYLFCKQVELVKQPHPGDFKRKTCGSRNLDQKKKYFFAKNGYF